MWSWKPTISSNELFHHGVKDQRWGVRNGPPYPLSNAAKKLANGIYKEAKRKELTITKDVMASAKLSGSEMYGLEHKLKTPESLTRKIKTNSEEDDVTYQDAAKGIKDAVRYTTITSDNNFVDSYQKMKAHLSNLGYEEVRCKNYFDLYNQGKVKHKSVQSVFRDKDGYEFELQFHTPSSQKAKNEKVPIYEERRKLGNTPERNAELEKQMVALAEKVTTPKGIEKIKSHDDKTPNTRVKERDKDK